MKLLRACKTNILTQKFGLNKRYYQRLLNNPAVKGHNGWDWAGNRGEPIYWDCFDCYGKVTKNHTDRSGGLGAVVVSVDKDGTFRHLFWHLKSFKAQPGDILAPGDIIGYMDSTGRSTGDHLHRAIKRAFEDKYGNYITLDGNNGYYGGIDIEPFFKMNVCIRDYIDILIAQLSILKKVVYLLKQLIKLLKP